MLMINFILQESSEFHKRSFEYAVDSIRAIAASHLWQVLTAECDKLGYVILMSAKSDVFIPFLQLVVVRANLNGHLRALKDYFLLAKGDFFQVMSGRTCIETNIFFV